MPWTEFCTLLSGLSPDTPFGKILAIRSEDNPETLKQFTPEAKKIRNGWLSKQAKKLIDENPKEAERQISEFEKAMAAMFG